MRHDLLAQLRCPFCGSAVTITDDAIVVREGDRIAYAVLGCPCCAYPVVDGIPVMIADDRARHAMNAIEARRPAEALDAVLALDPVRRAAFDALRARGEAATYREAIAALSPDAEGTYFIYRFSDPTFVAAAATLRAVAQAPRTLHGWVIDMCGGSGHLTRVLAGLRDAASPPQGAGGTVVADVYFWKLWLAVHFTSPGVEAVCCDGNDPLPFRRALASMVVLSDAFPYIWRRRALAEELMRLVSTDGVLVLPHLHSADGENVSAGMTLPPTAYADLFAPLEPRLFRDRDLQTSVLEAAEVDLTVAVAPDAFGAEPSLTLVASRRDDLFRRYAVPPVTAVTGSLAVNPLYALRRDGASTVLTLSFPTPEYEDEFGACRRYLPETLTVAADLTGPLEASTVSTQLGAQYDDLRRRLVLIDAPARYC